MGGSVNITMIGHFDRRPRPRPAKNKYPHILVAPSCMLFQKASITIVVLSVKKTSVETTPTCKKNSGMVSKIIPGR